MITCSKTYHDIPFAHRQHRHNDRCAFVHGHNWSVKFSFACHQTDENGFVVDLGKLGFIREWLDERLDHACVFNADDPLREQIVAAAPQAFKVYILKSASCEGLARHFHETFNPMIKERTGGRAWIHSVEVIEDGKNAAAYTP